MPEEPTAATRKAYLKQEIDGVTVYYPPGLVLLGSGLQIALKGFWVFKWLKLDGVAPVAACAF